MKALLKIASFVLAAAAVSCSKEGSSQEEIPELPETYKTETQRFPKEEGVMRLLSYNVGTFNKYMANSIPEVAEIILELKADAVILNEVDSCTVRNPRHQVKDLAYSLGGWDYVFGPALYRNNGAYGNAVVLTPSSPLKNSYSVVLGRFGGAEDRGLVVAESDKLVVMGTHLDHISEAARIQQAAAINTLVGSKYKGDPRPVFLLGDMNCEPKDAPVTELKKAWKVLSCESSTYPSPNPAKCIDFIMLYKEAAQVQAVGSGVPRYLFNGDPGSASDHLPIFVDYK